LEVGNRKGNLAPRALLRRLWSLRVTERAGIIRLSRLISCIVLLFCAAGVVAGAQDLRTAEARQPQGLKHAGIYDLKELDPTLDGAASQTPGSPSSTAQSCPQTRRRTRRPSAPYFSARTPRHFTRSLDNSITRAQPRKLRSTFMNSSISYSIMSADTCDRMKTL